MLKHHFNRSWQVWIFSLLITSPLSLAQPTLQATPGSTGSTNFTSDSQSIMARINQPFIGDLDQIRERRILRVLVSHNRTNFFETKRGKRGLEYDLLHAYENYLNRGPRKERYKTHIVFLIRPFNKLFPELQAGKGDMIASGLTITPERRARFDFTDPYISNIQEILIANKDADPVTRLEDLAGKQVLVVANSSYIIHLQMFNQFLGLNGLQPIEILTADPILEAEDILEMVNAGLYPYTVTDSHIAKIYSQILPDLKVYDDIIFHHGGRIAWAINYNLPELKASLNDFIRHFAKQGNFLGNSVFKKYFENTYWIKQPRQLSELNKIDCLTYFLQLYATFYDFDWYLIAALAYQESKFNQALTSPAGAYGIMQIKPQTAESKNVDITDIHNLEDNIHAGVKYLAFLRDTYFSGEEYSLEDRINFALAAYNAGPGRVRKMQRLAEAQGLDPYKWFYNVEVIARNTIGHETVDYVTKIQKTKLALQSYKNLSDRKNLLKAQHFEEWENTTENRAAPDKLESGGEKTAEKTQQAGSSH
ncbi:transglycosylase SLT domain-containing protein [Thiomicrorhabdus cannonii]|uniref:transglycosylase SLT domain-containing protein n=1 Tax=Thiomicrorhabdus cannonii TaxID=2748011 RepID=UPI001FE28992|nr:transporter substrate-binding domain-containing protein [Thiomicrorhabdus cannonii]